MYQTDFRINPTIVSEIKLEPIVVPTQAAVQEFANQDDSRIPFCEAICVPKVILYGMTFFSAKFSVYALLLWMPLFLGGQLGYDPEVVANILSVYEIGVICGTLILGYLSDLTYSRRSPVGITCITMSSIISFVIYRYYASFSPLVWTLWMFSLGFFLGTLHHMCCVTCPADIGREQRSKRATATITGIIDGIGTAGSGVGQLVLGTLIDARGWQSGFLQILFIVQACAFIPLALILYRELGEISEIRRN